MNEEDHQRADDLERALDEGDVARAAKMAMKWSSANAGVAVAEVQRRNDEHRKGASADAPGADGFSQRDQDLESLRAKLEA